MRLDLRKRFLILTGIVMSLSLSSCAFIVEEDDDDDDYVYYEIYDYPSTNTRDLAECDPDSRYYRPNSSFCAKGETKDNDDDQDLSWNTNCKGSDCVEVSIYVHYLLKQNLGPNQIVWVEAFNNPFFQGSPESSLYIGGFDTSSPSSTRREPMFLKSGEYYFRAYVHSGVEPALPLVFKGMQLVSDVPLGVFGALSDPQRVLIQKRTQNDAIHIEINQLLEDPDQKPETRARLRINFSTDPNAYIEADREIVIQLLGEADIEARPLEEFSISSNRLLVDGRVWEAEFISPDLAVGSYYIFSFLDENSNQYYDFGELAQIYQRYDEPWAVDIQADRTKSITLPLVLSPNFP